MPTETEPQGAASILEGLITKAELARQLGCSERFLERTPIPKIVVVRTRYYDPKVVREWLMSRPSRQDPVRCGRPSKRAA